MRLFSQTLHHFNVKEKVLTKNVQNSKSPDFLPSDDQHLHGDQDGQHLDGLLQEHHHLSDDLRQEEEDDRGGSRGHRSNNYPAFL